MSVPVLYKKNNVITTTVDGEAEEEKDFLINYSLCVYSSPVARPGCFATFLQTCRVSFT